MLRTMCARLPLCKSAILLFIAVLGSVIQAMFCIFLSDGCCATKIVQRIHLDARTADSVR